MRIEIVIGLNFGDEGKGARVNYLCSTRQKPLIVRFSGGHHVGHTVELKDGRRHVFHSFGSGTLKSAPTFWSKYCTIYPITFMKEYTDIKNSFDILPVSYFDPNVAITTIWDVMYNQALEKSRDIRHGSVGLGFGATIERQLTPYTLYFKDLYYPSVMEYKLNNIKQYYKNKVTEKVLPFFDFETNEDEFKQSVKNMLSSNVFVKPEKEIFSEKYDFIFEGSQGILLDQDCGFFPNVTRSNTVSKNAIEIIKRNFSDDTEININYISRIYMTRHGNGIFPTEGKTDHIKLEEDKTNFTNTWQGNLRKGCLDLELLKYSVNSNRIMNNNIKTEETIVFSCMDHLKDINSVLIKDIDNEYKTISYKDLCDILVKLLNNKNLKFFRSYNPFSEYEE